ncbi:uncharacterized protein PV06_02028 [Exophiala oligosperma]|uniref:F-box domain-containing protein n=1 Tax=Exophiala oligosperma TaxID=215243 RepID=A0A0D2C945_9EURO|nr:uncharacterized protein PV06_02028 [Exophiala oligosperma]KIW46352.1 hypothetical protein PV06_02028 [Exophiala oligosperma]
MKILEIPQELLAHILSFLQPQDIIRFSQTNKRAQRFASPQNQTLWRSAFLHLFDDPKDAWSLMPNSASLLKDSQFNWYLELVNRLSALRAIRSKWCVADETRRAKDHIDSLLSILDTAKFGPNARDFAPGVLYYVDGRDLSLNLRALSDTDSFREGLESLIHDTGTVLNSPHRPVTRSMAWIENEVSRPECASRLHVLFGLTVRERLEHRARGAARRKVYDWSLSGPDNDYGPFKRDGSGTVDWSLLEGIHSVVARNFSMCVGDPIFMPQGFSFSIPHRTFRRPEVPHDWARVTGPWLGTYAFLDYSDLFAYNAWEMRAGPRPTLDDEPEACGDLMRLDLELDASLAEDSSLHTALPVSHDLPPLYFRGLSRGQSRGQAGTHMPVISVRGCAWLVPGNREVRWRFIISYSGRDQWQLEGVQPGGIKSGGVFGLWTQSDHEMDGPVGPFCYFPEELCRPKSVVLVFPDSNT